MNRIVSLLSFKLVVVLIQPLPVEDQIVLPHFLFDWMTEQVNQLLIGLRK
jgi:hypothetical protein